MSNHYNNKQEKCWSCEFFSGERKHKQGLFLGDSTETAPTGTCSCKRSQKCNKTISESSWCSKYQKWGVLASVIAKKENEEQIRQQRLEQEEAERSRQEELESARRALERERLALEQERKKLEYERWYSLLSPEEREKEDLRVAEERKRKEKEAEERRVRREIENKEREKQRVIDEKKAKRKKLTKKVFMVVVIIAAITVLGAIIGSVVNSLRVDGTYYLTEVTGTGVFYYRESDNYLTLKDGICTLYFNTTEPVVHETFTYYYSGNYTGDIEFKKDNIYMDWNDRIVIELRFDDGRYNYLKYEKKK